MLRATTVSSYCSTGKYSSKRLLWNVGQGANSSGNSEASKATVIGPVLATECFGIFLGCHLSVVARISQGRHLVLV